MKIFLNNIRLHAFHGVMAQERIVGNDFLVSVEAETNFSDAMESDELADTISYASMAEVVCREMEKPSQLLEHVAGRIARNLLNEFPDLTSVTVRITKLAPPIPGLQCDGAGVEVKVKGEG